MGFQIEQQSVPWLTFLKSIVHIYEDWKRDQCDQSIKIFVCFLDKMFFTQNNIGKIIMQLRILLSRKNKKILRIC